MNLPIKLKAHETENSQFLSLVLLWILAFNLGVVKTGKSVSLTLSVSLLNLEIGTSLAYHGATLLP